MSSLSGSAGRSLGNGLRGKPGPMQLVAAQTDLLARNATIEAARAGEA